jgi:hypothetical protein
MALLAFGSNSKNTEKKNKFFQVIYLQFSIVVKK